jgi:uncharacterized iron-regulated membrane protein
VQAADPGARVTGFTVYADGRLPAAVTAGQRTLYVNAYSGHVYGAGALGARAFFRRVTDWHRWLGASPEGRATARAITGACNLAFLFIVVSGFYLWLPRTWSWAQVRGVAWFRGGLRGKARDFNWHNAIGLWSAVPLFVIVVSGVVISYPWASNLVYRAAGEQPPPRATPPAAPAGGGPSRGASPAPAATIGNLEALWATAERQVEGWKTISARLPGAPSGPVTFTIDQGDAGQPQKRGTLTLSAQTGEVVKWEPFAALSAGRRLRSYLRFAHTGEIFGLTGQTVAGLASLGGGVLVWTGLALALRRGAAWTRRRGHVRAAAPGRERAPARERATSDGLTG